MQVYLKCAFVQITGNAVQVWIRPSSDAALAAFRRSAPWHFRCCPPCEMPFSVLRFISLATKCTHSSRNDAVSPSKYSREGALGVSSSEFSRCDTFRKVTKAAGWGGARGQPLLFELASQFVRFVSRASSPASRTPPTILESDQRTCVSCPQDKKTQKKRGSPNNPCPIVGLPAVVLCSPSQVGAFLLRAFLPSVRSCLLDLGFASFCSADFLFSFAATHLPIFLCMS